MICNYIYIYLLYIIYNDGNPSNWDHWEPPGHGGHGDLRGIPFLKGSGWILLGSR